MPLNWTSIEIPQFGKNTLANPGYAPDVYLSISTNWNILAVQ